MSAAEMDPRHDPAHDARVPAHSGQSPELVRLQQRRRARRTAWLVAGLALLIYLLSILQGWYYS